MEENQAVVVSRLCTIKRDKRHKRDKLEGWLCRGAITQTDESVLVLNHWPETHKPDRADRVRSKQTATQGLPYLARNRRRQGDWQAHANPYGRGRFAYQQMVDLGVDRCRPAGGAGQ
jgi:hypothetical protein